MGGAKQAAIRETTAQKQRRALELRKEGHGYQAIAEQVGWANASSAHRAVKAALRAIPKEAADELRAVELARYDVAQRELMRRIRRGGSSAIDAIHAMIRLSDQRAKLTGLYTADSAAEHVEVRVALQQFLATAISMDAADSDPEPGDPEPGE